MAFQGGNTQKEDEVPQINDQDFPPGSTRQKPQKRINGEQKFSDGAPTPIPKGETALALTERDLPEPVRLCDPWATEGVNIIAGRPKLGKTTLERQKLAAAVTATEFLDSKFNNAVNCAFLSLEEGELLCRMKFTMHGFNEAALAGINLHFDWPRGQDGVDLLDRYLVENRDVKLVCIDSLTKFRTIPDHRTPAFMADYEAINSLHEMAKKHPGVCIDIIHHTRKAKSDDPIDDISGTYGLTAAADCCVVLRHHADGALMYVNGRMWNREENQYTLKRGAKHTWDMIGVNLGLSDEQMETLNIVKKAGSEGLNGRTLAQKLDIADRSAWDRLDNLMEKGFITKKFGRCFAK